MRNFRLWLEAEKDIYGFNQIEQPPVKPPDEKPIQPFYLNKLLDNLEHKSFKFPVLRKFEDQVQWGNSDGAIRARLTPNQCISLERMTTDLTGQPLWVTKKLFKIKTSEFVDHEDTVANEIAEQVKEILHEQIDSPEKEYQNLHALTKRLAGRMQSQLATVFYQEIKKVSENNYNVLFSFPGAGVGKLAHKGRHANLSSGIVDMSFDPERGAIKSIVTSVSVDNEGGAWVIDVPYFTGEFSPSQPMEEIIHTIIGSLKFI